MKIITLCGSMKFQKEMQEVAERLTLEGNCVLSAIYPVDAARVYTGEEKELLAKAHLERIRLSDAIFVVNIGNYIGSSTKAEIALAEELGKEILYYIEG